MKKALYIISGILLIAGLLLGAGCSRGDEEVAEEEEKEEAAEDPRMELRKVDPVLVIINNHAAARPQSGLQQASIVYEFLVEGESPASWRCSIPPWKRTLPSVP